MLVTLSVASYLGLVESSSSRMKPIRNLQVSALRDGQTRLTQQQQHAMPHPPPLPHEKSRLFRCLTTAVK